MEALPSSCRACENGIEPAAHALVASAEAAGVVERTPAPAPIPAPVPCAAAHVVSATAAASAADLASWTTAISAVRGSTATIGLSQMIDLNADGVAEGFACVTGGMGSPCYVIETVGEVARFYSTTLQWNAESAELPQFFATDKGTYIAHSPKESTNNRGGGIIRLVRFDGSGYATESIQ